MNELDLFAAAIAIADPVERAALLERECAGRPELRRRLDQLLDAHGRSGLLLDRPALGQSQDGLPPKSETADYPGRDEVAGAVIAGRYTLIEVVGEGGMGAVWRAKQMEPVKRFVAVKLIKPGMDSKRVLGRFEAERQALALMDHPNIAKVLDGGLHDNRPYFVMELVKGTPITEYCDQHKLTPRERLELFVPVCHAIQHAHQKGIIHRDIKPSNVLVAMYDDKPVVKVIDFGVAKATGGTLTERTIDTGFGVVVGTPQYMSPEQATFNNLDIDTRSDVYALGVLLYELLTGSTPVDRKSLGKAAILEVLRVVREVEGGAAKHKLSTLDTLPSVAANRGTQPAQLSRLMKGELDWLVLKALEKDRTRRYETANGFAADILRYLSGEPVQAVPPSTSYRLKKFYRRNKRPVLAAGLLFLALLMGVAGTTYGLVRSEQAANREAARSKQLTRSNDVLTSVLKSLDPHDEQATGPLRAQLGQKFRKAATDLEGDSLGHPLEVARLQYLLGVSLLGLGYEEDAAPLLGKARTTFDRELGPDNEESMHAAAYLADALLGLDDTVEGNRLRKDVLERRTRVLGPDHPDTLVALYDFAASLVLLHRTREAIPLFEAAFAKHKAARGEDHPFTLLLASGLSKVLIFDKGRADEALKLAESTYERLRASRGLAHPRTIHEATVLGAVLSRNSQLERAVPFLEENLVRARLELGPDHPYSIDCAGVLASVLGDRKVDRAITLREEVVVHLSARHGPHHPKTLAASAELAGAYLTGGRREKSLALAEETLRAAEKRLGLEHDTTLNLVNRLGMALLETKVDERVVALAERYLAGVRRKRPDPDDNDVINGLNNLGEAYRRTGKLDLAKPLLEEAIAASTCKYGEDHLRTLNSMGNLGYVLVAMRKPAQAVPLLEKAAQGFTSALGRSHRWSYGIQLELGRAYSDLAQYQKASTAFERAVTDLKAALGEENAQTLRATNDLANMRLHLNQPDKAIRLLDLAIPLLEKVSGPNHRDTLVALELRAAAYSTSKDVDMFVSAAIQLWDRQRAVHGPDHGNTLYAANMMGSAYQKAGKLEQAEKSYRELLAQYERLKGADHFESLPIRFNLALALTSQQKYEEGLPLMERAVTGIVKHHGKESSDARETLKTLSQNYLAAKQFEKAIPILETTLEKCRKELAPNHKDLRETVGTLGDAYAQAGRPKDALPLAEEMVRWNVEANGAESVKNTRALETLASINRSAGRPMEAIAVRERIRDACEKELGPNDRNTLIATENLAYEFMNANRIPDSIREFERTRTGWEKARGPESPESINCLKRIGATYWQYSQFDQAISVYERLVAAFKNVRGATHSETLLAMTNLGANYREAGRVDEAIAILESVCRETKEPGALCFARQGLLDSLQVAGQTTEALALAKIHIAAIRKSVSAERADNFLRAGLTLVRLKAFAEAEIPIREGLSIREKTQPDSWRTYSAKSLLGHSLLGQKKVAEAEPLLLEGYERLVKTETTIPPVNRFVLADAVDRLIEFYTATNNPDEAKKWQAERAKYPPPRGPMPREVK